MLIGMFTVCVVYLDKINTENSKYVPQTCTVTDIELVNYGGNRCSCGGCEMLYLHLKNTNGQTGKAVAYIYENHHCIWTSKQIFSDSDAMEADARERYPTNSAINCFVANTDFLLYLESTSQCVAFIVSGSFGFLFIFVDILITSYIYLAWGKDATGRTREHDDAENMCFSKIYRNSILLIEEHRRMDSLEMV
jgi:hypothetical protein